MARRRARAPGRHFLHVSRRQLAGLGIVGALGVIGGLNGVIDLAEKLGRLAHGHTPSGKPLNGESTPPSWPPGR